jgi:hypothetical protein
MGRSFTSAQPAHPPSNGVTSWQTIIRPKIIYKCSRLGAPKRILLFETLDGRMLASGFVSLGFVSLGLR